MDDGLFEEIEVWLRCPDDNLLTRKLVLPDEMVHCRGCGRRLTGEHKDPLSR